MKKNIEIISWNVNGLRSVYNKGFIEWLIQHEPYVLCLQEIKSKRNELPIDLIDLKGYYTFWHSAEKPGYSGTAIFSKEKPLAVEMGLGDVDFDSEGRVLITHFPDFTIINCYVPNGRPDHSRVNFKIKFYSLLLEKSLNLKNDGKNVIICGDWNVAHKEIDLFDPKSNFKKTGFLKEERECIDKFIGHGFQDVYRYFYPDLAGKYTWWLVGGNSKKNNTGWRFDYFFTNNEFLDVVSDSKIYKEIDFSDHCPISIILSVANSRERVINKDKPGKIQQVLF